MTEGTRTDTDPLHKRAGIRGHIHIHRRPSACLRGNERKTHARTWRRRNRTPSANDACSKIDIWTTWSSRYDSLRRSARTQTNTHAHAHAHAHAHRLSNGKLKKNASRLSVHGLARDKRTPLRTWRRKSLTLKRPKGAYTFTRLTASCKLYFVQTKHPLLQTGVYLLTYVDPNK